MAEGWRDGRQRVMSHHAISLRCRTSQIPVKRARRVKPRFGGLSYGVIGASGRLFSRLFMTV